MKTRRLLLSFLLVAFMTGLFYTGQVAAEKDGCKPAPMTEEEYDDLYGGD